MYQFVDTVKQDGTVAESMPAESLRINGDYIENLMDVRYCTYRTLYVRGRESMLAELNTFETGVKDGSGLLSKRFPAREIVVGFKLQAYSNAYFRLAFNQLNSILNVKDAEIMFYDEQDKYFIGTPQGLDEIEPGSNFVQGEFIIYCADPFKYSLKEHEVEPTEDNGSTFVIDYNGTYKAFPTLEADFAGDCGYVAWFSQDSKIIQLGDSDEADMEEYEKSDTILSQTFATDQSLSAWRNNYSYSGKPIWIVPNGSSYGLSGSPSLATIAGNGSYYVTSYDFMDSPGGWTGTSISQAIEGTEWTLNWSQILSIGDGGSNYTNRGGIEAIVIDSSGNTIAATTMYKTSSGTTGYIGLYTNSQSSTKSNIDYSRYNSRWGTKGSCSMVKSGSTVTWNLGGLSYSLTDSKIASMTAARVVFVFLRLSSYSYMVQGIYSITFKKDNVTDWRDIPNKFGAGDVATVDCEDGVVKMNGSEAPGYGAIGNQWEEFCLSPGYNQIGFSYSDWCTSKPSTKLRYREVYI